MNAIEERLQSELRTTRERLRHLGLGVMVEEVPGVVGEDAALTDTADVGRANEEREMSCAGWSRLVDRAGRLAHALDRLAEGAYGVCEECEEPINPRRLDVIPEATTCVRCQDRLERWARQRVVAHPRRNGSDA